jgi:hypothetical protein
LSVSAQIIGSQFVASIDRDNSDRAAEADLEIRCKDGVVRSANNSGAKPQKNRPTAARIVKNATLLL